MKKKNYTKTSRIKQQENDIKILKSDVTKLNEFALQMKEKEVKKEFPTFSHLLRKMALEKDYPTWNILVFQNF